MLLSELISDFHRPLVDLMLKDEYFAYGLGCLIFFARFSIFAFFFVKEIRIFGDLVM